MGRSPKCRNVQPSPMTSLAGSAALGLINTLAIWRPGDDRIATPAMLGDWLGRQHLFSFEVPAPNISHVRFFRELRLAIWHCAKAAAIDQRYSESDVEIINRYAALAGCRPQLVQGRATEISKNPRTAALALFAADAIELLTVHRAQVRFCPECHAAYLDGAENCHPLNDQENGGAPN